MRNVILAQNVTVDGFFAGPKGELDWPIVDDEFNEYAVNLLDSVDTLLFGRVTYRFMADYWSSPEAPKQNPVVIVDKMNNLAKVVFSKTLEKAVWKNSRLVKGSIGEEVSKRETTNR